MWCEVQIASKQCLICSLYVPPKHKEDLVKLCKKFNSVDDKKPLLIAGDFNARSQLWDPQLIPSGDPVWQMGDLLIDMIFYHNLLIHNNGIATFLQKEYSTLDVTLTRNMPFKIKWSADINSILQTDRYAIIDIIDICTNNMTTKSKSGTLRIRNLWRTELDKLMLDWSNSLPDYVTLKEIYTSFTSTILACAEKVIQR